MKKAGRPSNASKKLKNAKIIAVDILDMENIPNVDFVQSDIEDFCLNLEKRRDLDKIDLVMSDIAPNISGIESADAAAGLHLAEIVTEIALDVLNDSGNLLIKLFQGKGTDEFLSEIRKLFGTVRIIKPKASKTNSREIYMLATNMKINNSGLHYE